MPLLGLVRLFLPNAGKMIVYAVLGAVYLGIAGAALATYAAWVHHQRMIGWHGAIEAVAKQDQKAVGAATVAKNRADACDDGGGNWNVSTGKCDDAGGGGDPTGISRLFND